MRLVIIQSIISILKSQILFCLFASVIMRKFDDFYKNEGTFQPISEFVNIDIIIFFSKLLKIKLNLDILKIWLLEF